MYYGIIVVISLLTLFLVPMLGSELGLKWVLPNTAAGWVVYVVSNIISTVLNLLMFHSFVKQGKVNIIEEKKYLEAKGILQKLTEDDAESKLTPLSPAQWHSKEYRTKAISLAVFTLLGTIGFANAILTFDVVKFIAQIICLVSGLIFGFIEMKAVEEYWTVDYYEYALYLQKQKTKKSQQQKQPVISKPTEQQELPANQENLSETAIEITTETTNTQFTEEKETN